VVVLAVVLVAACGSPAAEPVAGPTTTAVPAATTIQAPVASAPPVTASTTTVVPAASTTATVELPDRRLAQAGPAGQVVVVNAPRYGATTATLTAYERTVGGSWSRAFGPWPARVGTRGVAPPGEKREGDGRTPSGVYGFDFFFGVAADPGVRFPYRRVTSRSIVWDDDPSSPRYNTWVDLEREQAGTEPEPMYVSPAYDHGAVIAYNAERTPGLGSAIFLHVSTGAPTAGCVSLPASQLVEVLRWLDPVRQPRIVLGVES
jgi:L,D-peptidoglycan transpeptidase YkuD (ErfK/YbiS/YcfS/YnhG family)